jgi:hypothetical protein
VNRSISFVCVAVRFSFQKFELKEAKGKGWTRNWLEDEEGVCWTGMTIALGFHLAHRKCFPSPLVLFPSDDLVWGNILHAWMVRKEKWSSHIRSAVDTSASYPPSLLSFENWTRKHRKKSVLYCASSSSSGNFSLHHRVQTGSGAHPASYPMGTRDSFPGGKAAGAWSWPLTSI